MFDSGRHEVGNACPNHYGFDLRGFRWKYPFSVIARQPLPSRESQPTDNCRIEDHMNLGSKNRRRWHRSCSWWTPLPHLSCSLELCAFVCAILFCAIRSVYLNQGCSFVQSLPNSASKPPGKPPTRAAAHQGPMTKVQSLFFTLNSITFFV